MSERKVHVGHVDEVGQGDARLASEDARECECGYELVEDGSVQRKRWFHERGCAGAQSPSGPDAETLCVKCGLSWHPLTPDGLCDDCEDDRATLAGPDAETLAATVRRGISATRVPRDSAVGQRLAAALEALSGLVALVEQRERELARHRQALERATALADTWERDALGSLGEYGVPTSLAPLQAVEELRAALSASAPGTEEPT